MIAQLELKNPSEFPRDKTPVYVSFYDLGIDADQADGLLLEIGQNLQPTQLVDEDGDGTTDGILALVDLRPAQSKLLSYITQPGTSAPTSAKLTQAEISHKVGGEWKARAADPTLKEYVGGTFKNVKAFSPPAEHTDHSKLIRYEGPGIESDKVAYRIYLDRRNGFDIFGKKVNEPVLHGVGQDGYESYHQMSSWGMDILKVGESLGTGGFGFWNKGKVELVSAVDGWHVAVNDDGNLRSAFEIQYKGWKVAKQSVDVNASFSMRGGSRLVHVELELSEMLPNIAVGLVKHEGTELLLGSTEVAGSAYTYAASWGKQSLNGDMLGMAVLFRKGALVSHELDKQNYVTVLEPSGTKLDYYFLAAWAGEPFGIQTKEAFVKYLETEAAQLTFAPRMQLETALSKRSKSFPITAHAALGWSRRLADSELDRKALKVHYDGWDENRGRKPRFEYDIVGLQPLAYDELNQVAPNPRYAEVISKVTGSYVTDTGKIRAYDQKDYNIDSVLPGRALLRLLDQTKDTKYKKAAEVLRAQLKRQPKTQNGAFWHKKRYPWQLWLDGVYMGMPFLAEYTQRFEDGESLDEVVTEFNITRTELRSESTGLYFHAWDEKKQQPWADPNTGRSKYHWGRGMGWFAMAVVDVLDSIPVDDEERRRPLLEIAQELAEALVRYQDPKRGTWWQIVDRPQAVGNYPESTASAMFSYFFAKAVRKGVLPESYRAVALKAYEGLIQQFVTVHANGQISMTGQCLVAGLGYGRDGSYEYYMSEPVVENDPKGNGPFILAGIEIYRLLKAGS